MKWIPMDQIDSITDGLAPNRSNPGLYLIGPLGQPLVKFESR